MKKRILVLGGTGFIGSDFVEQIVKSNKWEIIVANRGYRNIYPFIKSIKIDRNDKESCDTLNGVDVDSVVDFSCYNKKHIENILEKINYKNYILVSSTAAVDENVLNNKENSFFKYAHEKREMEEVASIFLVKEKLIIARPPIVYGANDYTNRFFEKNGLFFWMHDGSLAENTDFSINKKNLTEIILLFLDLMNLEQPEYPFKKIEYINTTGALYESIYNTPK